MGVSVRLEAVLEAEGFHANVAMELLDFVMLNLDVLHQRCGAGHLLLTDLTNVRRSMLVMEVNAPFPASVEDLLADSALEAFFENVDLGVLWAGFLRLHRISRAVLFMNPQLAVECEAL